MSDLKDVQNKEQEIDLTEARHKRCLPIIKMVLEELLIKKIPLQDMNYIEARLLEVLQSFYKGIAIEHSNEIFQVVNDSLAYSLDKANEKHWGKKRNQITVDDIENVLKKSLPTE